jgi:UDP-GlcNAc:undecaprenyl-phosphate GlcNAc-1-phosphate transferase
VYLGDAGSYLLGAVLAVLLMAAADEGVATASGALLFVGVPVADTVVAIVRRLRARRPLMRGDRGHVYDQLVDRGWPVPRTVLACVAAQGVLAVAGIAIAGMPRGPAVAVAVTVIVVTGAAALAVFTSPRTWADR